MSVLTRAAYDSELLVAYLARARKGDAAEMIAANPEFVSIPAAVLADQNIGDDQKAKLWGILGKLMALAYPATPASIRDSHYASELGSPDRLEQAPRRRRFLIVSSLGFAALLATLLIGLYVSVTETVVVDAQKLVTEYARLTSGDTAGTRLEGVSFARAAADRPPSAATAAETQAQTSATTPAAGDEIVDDERRDTSVGEFDSREFLFQRARAETEREYQTATRFLSLSTFGLAGERSDASRTTGAAGGASIFDRSLPNLQRYINTVLSSYFLPLSAAVLGAFVYIMRDRTARMESLSLSPREEKTYFPRMIVAAVAGIIIGWFTAQDATGVLGKLSPAAGAFLVGYSTEIMFQILDAIKHALGAKTPEQVDKEKQ